MRYYAAKPKLKRKERKEVEKKFTSLDKAILCRAKGGCDVMSLIGVCKPFTNQYGTKEFASTDSVRLAIARLQKLGYLVRK